MRKEINGVPLNYKLYQQAGAGRPWLVLIHSLGVEQGAWREQVGPLGENYNLLTYDLRGAGRSSWLPPNTSPAADEVGNDALSIGLLTSDLRGLLLVLGHTEDVTLLGWAFGGMVALDYAANYSVRALVLACTTAGLPAETQAVFRARAQKVEAGPEQMQVAIQEQINRWLNPAAQAKRPDLVAYARETLERQEPASLAAMMRTLAAADLRPQLSRVNCPSLVLAGEVDVAAPTALVQEVADGIKGQFDIIKGAGHLAPLQEAQQYNGKVLAFLQQL